MIQMIEFSVWQEEYFNDLINMYKIFIRQAEHVVDNNDNFYLFCLLIYNN